MDFKTRDIPGTAAYFSDVLGWQFAVDDNDWRRATVITVAGYRIGTVSDLAAPIYPAATPPHVAFYLAVDDADRRTSAAEDNGAQVIVAPFDAADQGRVATLIDPHGAVVSLWQPASGHGWRHPPGLLNAPYRMVLPCADPPRARNFYRDTLGAGLRHTGFLQDENGTGTVSQWQLLISADLHEIAQRVACYDHDAGIAAALGGSGLLPVRTSEGITVYATARPTAGP